LELTIEDLRLTIENLASIICAGWGGVINRHSSIFIHQSGVAAVAAGKDQALRIGAGGKREALHNR
jgi:hypothetical protein